MQKSIIVLFALFYLFTVTEFKQFLKIPVLIDHYFEHVEENEHLSLVDFVSIHYMEGLVYDDDVARDMQLPFRNPDQQVSISIVSTEIEFSFNYEHFLDFSSITIHVFNDSRPALSFSSSIWHPPQA
jgi:hypothetical protein